MKLSSWLSYKNLPCHKRIIQGKPLIEKDGKLLSQKDRWGLSAYDLDRLLDRGNFASHGTAPPIYMKGELVASTPREYEEVLQIHYIPHLIFDNFSVLQKVLSQCAKAAKKEEILTIQRWMGCYYQQEIRNALLPKVSVHWIDEKIGFGLFADENFPAKSYIGQYTGRLRKRRGRRDNKNSYLFEYLIGNERTPFTIDAQDDGNYCRFINHSKNGNCEPLVVYHDGMMKVIIHAKGKIQKGEEITYDYGDKYWSKREAPLSR